MEYLRRPAWAGAATLLMAAALTAGISAQKSKDTKDKDQKDADPRPKLTLRANPVIAMAPARVVLTAELNGGANTVEHVFRAGMYRVMFHLKRHDKAVGNATIQIQVRPGLRDGF